MVKVDLRSQIQIRGFSIDRVCFGLIKYCSRRCVGLLRKGNFDEGSVDSGAIKSK